QIGTAHTGGALGAQRQLALAQVAETVHLLLHHLARLARGAREQLVLLEDRRADLAVAAVLERLARARFGPLPALDLPRQEVAGAARRLVLERHRPSRGTR